MADLTKIVEELSSLTVMQAADLSKLLEEKWGVSATVTAAAAPVEAALEVVAEQTEFDVTLVSAGGKKIEVIKTVRAITGLGLKEAKDVVDSAPSPVKQGVSKTEADEIKTKLETAGATVEVK